MSRRKSRYAEIVVRLVPSRSQALVVPESAATAPAAADRERVYNALVYTKLQVPGLNPVAEGVATNQPGVVAKLPLVGSEKIVVRWDKYRSYLTAFVAGEKAAFDKLWHLLPPLLKNAATPLKRSKSELFEPPSPALRAIFRGEVGTDLPLRVWWSSPSPEVTYLPWELFAYGEREALTGGFSFVRGEPAEPILKVPISGPLRIAFVHSREQTPESLLKVMNALKGIEVIEMCGNPLEDLRRAVREGYELIHLVSDGAISLANEGILYLRKTPPPDSKQPGPFARRGFRIVLNLVKSFKLDSIPKIDRWVHDKVQTKLNIEVCPTKELSTMLRGSRVAVLSLTPPKTDDDDPGRMDGFILPSVYKAFAGVGNSRLTLPSIVAPLGAASEEQQHAFWLAFYPALTKTRSVEEAVAEGQAAAGGLTLPIALFLRQRLGREFARESAARRTPPGANPAQLNAELEASRDFFEQLRAVDSKYKGLTDNVTDTDLARRERERRSTLAKDLESWKQLEEE